MFKLFKNMFKPKPITINTDDRLIHDLELIRALCISNNKQNEKDGADIIISALKGGK